MCYRITRLSLLLTVVVLGFYVQEAAMGQVSFTCPSASKVTIHPGKTVNSATGDVIRNSTVGGISYVPMTGDTKSTKAITFIAAFLREGMFACAYEGNTTPFAIMNYEFSGDIWNCHFKNHSTTCKGKTPEHCILTCSGS